MLDAYTNNLFYFQGHDGYAAYLSEEYGRLVDSVSRVLLVTNFLVHAIDNLEILSLLMLIQRLHISRLLIAFLKQILGLCQRPSLCASGDLQPSPLRVFLLWSLGDSLLCLFHRFFAALCRNTSTGGNPGTLGKASRTSSSTAANRAHILCFSCHILYLFSDLRNS
jgi:hypothetical protein